MFMPTDPSPIRLVSPSCRGSVDTDELWMQYRRDAYAGIVMSVIAPQIVGTSARSEGMFAAMATRHAQHALDLESETLL